jgi:hypothetical protein
MSHALDDTATINVPRETRSGVVTAAIAGPTRSPHIRRPPRGA